MYVIRKVDKNQKEIIKCFEQFGFSVCDLHNLGKGVPDILIAKDNTLYLVEIKDSKNKLTDDQEDFEKKWKSRIYIVRTVEDVKNLYDYHVNYIRKLGVINGLQ